MAICWKNFTIAACESLFVDGKFSPSRKSCIHVHWHVRKTEMTSFPHVHDKFADKIFTSNANKTLNKDVTTIKSPKQEEELHFSVSKKWSAYKERLKFTRKSARL